MADEEFHRGSQITMTFESNPELIAVLREWSDNVPTLYFVDICAANVTKLLPKAVEGDARKAALVERLKRLDKPQNSFSYLLALIEKVNDTRSTLSDTELQEQILQDVAALRTFFVNARVIESEDYLVSFAKDLRGEPHELKHSDYIQFLRIVNDHFKLGNPVAKSLRLQKAEEILKEADTLSIGRQHTVVLVTLACLYGNSSAKKVMKFKAAPEQFDAENALADIMTIARFIPKKLEIEHYGRKEESSFLRLDFLTDDGGLSGIMNCFEGESVKSEQKGEVHQTQTTLTVKYEFLFPELPTQTEGETEKNKGPTQSEHSELEKLYHLLFANQHPKDL